MFMAGNIENESERENTQNIVFNTPPIDLWSILID